MALSLRHKAAAVFVSLAVLPAAVTGSLLVGINADAVRTSERQLQAAVLSELSAWVDAQMNSAQDELQALSHAITLQAANGEEPSLTPLRSLVASGSALDSVRFQVPARGVDVLLSDGPSAETAWPAELGQRARSAGVAVGRGGQEVWMVAWIPRQSAAGAEGFVGGRVPRELFARQLEDVVTGRFGGGNVSVAVGDRFQGLVASHSPTPLKPTALADSGLYGWSSTQEPPSTSYSIVKPLTAGGEEMLGGMEVAAHFGWSVAMWRPQQEAYATIAEMQSRTLQAALTATVLALLLGLLAARRLTRPLLQMVSNAELIGQRKWGALRPVEKPADELGQLASSLESMALELQESEQQIRQDVQLRSDLSRYMSQQLVDRIVSGKHRMDLGGTRANVTVLFADVVAFTPIAESGEPEQVVSLLNEFFSLITEIIFRHGGVVDKFQGDSVMAIWGAPELDQEHASHALRAAEDILRYVELANPDWEERFGHPVRVGLGVNSGECVVGNIGSLKRMEYTVIGDSVNVAARLEQRAAPGQVLLGEATRSLAGDEFEFSFTGEHQEQGREKPVSVYELGVDL